MACFVHSADMPRTFVLLLVEDDRVLGFITAEALRSRDHTVMWASTVNAAHDHLRQRSDFHAMPLDLDLGGERGESLVERLQAESVKLPEIIILSAQPLDVLVRTQRALGACAIMQKPASVEDIERELERCVPR